MDLGRYCFLMSQDGLRILFQRKNLCSYVIQGILAERVVITEWGSTIHPLVFILLLLECVVIHIVDP